MIRFYFLKIDVAALWGETIHRGRETSWEAVVVVGSRERMVTVERERTRESREIFIGIINRT